MMKLIIDYKKGMDLTKIDCFGVVVNSKDFSMNVMDAFNFEEIDNILFLIESSNKKTILNVDRIIREIDLDDILEFLDKVINKFDYFLYSDMAIYSYFEEKELLNKLIYYPKTLVSSSFELSELKYMGVNSFISNELSLEEIKEIDKKGIKYNVEAFGYHQMFYSRRNLLSLFKEFFNLEGNVRFKELKIKEELRNEFYPIYESNNGTTIYTDYCYFLFEELKELENVEMVYLNGIFIDLDVYLKVIDCYSNIIKGVEFDSLDTMNNLGIKLSKGFLMQKSVLLKAGEKDE